MPLGASSAIFENRHDAGQQLATQLGDYRGQPLIVLAIPNGGVPVALPVAGALHAEFDLIICRKIPLPLSPEAGFGAIADDGTIILNEELVRRASLSRQQIEYEASRVRVRIKERIIYYRGTQPVVTVSGKTVILIDDGLASGYTMMAAVESVRRRRPREVVVAVPCASAVAEKQLSRVADRVITGAIGYAPRFAVADFYRFWYDVNDDEILQYLKQWRTQSFWSNIEPPRPGWQSDK